MREKENRDKNENEIKSMILKAIESKNENDGLLNDKSYHRSKPQLEST